MRIGTTKSGCLGGRIKTRASSVKAEHWLAVCVPDSCGKALLFREKNILLARGKTYSLLLIKSAFIQRLANLLQQFLESERLGDESLCA
jgi:hypothetical protein